MVERKKPVHTHLTSEKEPVWWNWWAENPTEVILVVFILVFFFLLPRAGCGVTQVTQVDPGAQPTQQGQP